jgi:biotin-(acetyl-CoA carboxylase) ligase
VVTFIDMQENVFEAVVLGVSFDGKLILKFKNEKVEEFEVKTLKFLLP